MARTPGHQSRRKIEPGISRTSAATYMVRYYDPDGRERAKNFKRLTPARNFKATVRISKERGEFLDPQQAKRKFKESAEDFLSRRNLSRRTRDRYLDILRVHLFPAFGHRSLSTIKVDDVQVFISDLPKKVHPRGRGYAPETIRGIYNLLAAILAFEVNRGALVKTPCRGIDLPKRIKKEPRFLPTVGVERLASTIDRNYMVLVYIAGYIGLRWQEVSALRPEHIKMPLREPATISIVSAIERSNGLSRPKNIGKTDAAHRTLKLPQFLRDALSQHLRDYANEEWVFPAPKGRFLLYDNFRKRIWKPAVKAADLNPLSFHELRHTAAAFLIDDGANHLQVKRRMGHESITTTIDLYGHLFDQREDEVAERLNERHRVAQESDADYLRTRGGNVVRLMQADKLADQET